MVITNGHASETDSLRVENINIHIIVCRNITDNSPKANDKTHAVITFTAVIVPKPNIAPLKSNVDANCTPRYAEPIVTAIVR